MASPIFEFDPTSEDAANANLVVSSGSYAVEAFSSPMPQPDVLYASSVDTEGENPASTRFRNRTIGLTVHVDVATNYNALRALEQKVGKILRERGTLKVTFPNSEVVIFDLLSVDSYEMPWDDTLLVGSVAVVPLQFTAKPYGRGPEVDMGDNVETTLPWLVFTETGVKGTAPGLGRLVVDNDDASNDQWWLVWGIQSRYYSADASAALGWQAESLTAMGGSATNAGPAGASGSSVMRNTTVQEVWQPVLSTQATGGGAHMSHVGSFRVFARVQAAAANAVDTYLRFEWGEGDLRRYTRNSTVTIESEFGGSWRIVDLGMVTLTTAVSGTQRWEGRVHAKTVATASNKTIDIDWLMLVPVDEGSAEVSGVHRTAESALTYSAYDAFAHSGALTGKTLPVGGTWTGAGDGDDFSAGTGVITRTAVSDANVNTGRYVTASSPTLSNTIVSARRSTQSLGFLIAPANVFGVIARYTDANNWLMARLEDPGSGAVLAVYKRVSGTVTQIGSVTMSGWTAFDVSYKLQVDTSGRFQAWFWETGSENGTAAKTVTGYDTDLAQGGALATGKPGLYDAWTSATANTRTYDDFVAYSYSVDAAIFASQSMEIRHNTANREDSAGAVWTTPSKYVGDYLLVPPAGSEGRPSRIIVKASRGNTTDQPDRGIDDISARLYVTPRYLQIPDA
jgi:hypothetical protein